jgi:hypothetical protein
MHPEGVESHCKLETLWKDKAVVITFIENHSMLDQMMATHFSCFVLVCFE